MKPAKFIGINPHLPVKNLRETLDYYRDELGFFDEWTEANHEGRLTDGGCCRDTMRMLFGEDSDFVDAILSYGKSRLSLMWFVENIYEIYAEFRKRGVDIADELRQHAYGLLEFAFVDINGYYIRVAEGQS